MTLFVLDEARDDAYDAWRWYEEQQDGLGDKFYAAFEKTLAHVEANPQHFTFCNDLESFRDTLIPRYPYLVVFKLYVDTIVVHAVRHTSRDKIGLL